MRKNLPINDTQTLIGDDQYLISKTDLKGRITFCNPAFAAISGFSQEELIGKAHNIVRHPDIPEAVFKEMWQTLQSNKPWVGVVKNRSKDGGYYWVLATVMPIMELNEVVGYASVRVKASDEQIAAADQFYKDINQNKWGGYTVKHGQKVPTGWRKALAALSFPFRRGLQPTMVRYAIALLALAGIPVYIAAEASTQNVAAWLCRGYGFVSILAVYSSLNISRRFLKPIKEAEEMARQITGGNLVLVAPKASEPELQQLYFFLDTMRKSLTGIVNEITSGIKSNAHTVDQLKANSLDLASRTEQQAASLQQTAASLEQLTVTVKQNADNARSANRISEESMEVARTGGQAVGNVVHTMKGIQESSKMITEIVVLIQGIAAQTNILALNATIEAAHAGDQGRGFAVVASEVRSLAQKTSTAAKEIENLLRESADRIDLGSLQADEAGKTMENIVLAVQGMANIMDEISTASVEQAKGLEQINVAVNQMDGVTHLNGSLVQELSHSAESLGDESRLLNNAINVFNTPHAK